MFVRDQSSQKPAHRREHLIQIQARDDGVVHLEQQLEPIALACQCLLCRSDAFVVQDVIDSDGYLIRDLLHEVQVRLLIARAREAAKSERAETTKRGGERDGAERTDAVLPHHRNQAWEPVLDVEIFDHERLLRSPDQTRGGLVDRQLQPRMNRGAFRSHENVQPHHVARGIVQQQVDVVERDHRRQPMGEILEQIVQVPVSRNRFRDLQQESQPIALVAQLELDGPIAFVVQDIVDRDRHLLHDEVEELQVRVVDGMRARRAESHRSERPHGRRQRQHAEGLDAERLDQRRRGLEAQRFLLRADDDGLLRGQRETAERRGDGHFETRRNPIAVHAAEHVNPHDVLDRIMKEQGDQLEWNDGGQSLREIAEQARQVAMRGDRFRHLYQ